jgi:hypothetical protein
MSPGCFSLILCAVGFLGLFGLIPLPFAGLAFMTLLTISNLKSGGK